MTLVPLEDIGRHWFFSQCLPEVFQDSPTTSGFCPEDFGLFSASKSSVNDIRPTQVCLSALSIAYDSDYDRCHIRVR